MDAGNLPETLEHAVTGAIVRSVYQIRGDIERRLKQSLEGTTHPIAHLNLQALLDNLNIAKRKHIPLCQDTGVPTFFLDLGVDFPFRLDFPSILSRAVRSATASAPLRPNAITPFLNENTGDNTGKGWPIIYTHFQSDSKELRIRFLMKGGGSENCSGLFMLSPTVTVPKICEKLAEWVINAKGKPCPPVILGIGIGGDAPTCLKLAKEALLQPLDREPDIPELAEITRGVVQRVNEEGKGPMGLGGTPTCLGATINWAMRHPASFPVGLVVQCHAHRGGEVAVNEKGEVTVVE